MDKIFENEELAKYYERYGIEFNQTWPFSIEYFNKLEYFIGIDWSGVGNDVENKQGEIERPVFYAARGSKHHHMACIKPKKSDGSRNPKYRDLDSIARVQNITGGKELWYCAVDQLQLPKGVKVNDDYLTKIIIRLTERVNQEKKFNFSSLGILVDGWFKKKEKIVERLKRKDSKFSGKNIVSYEDGDRNIRIVSSADNVAYYLRNHYIETGEILRPDKRVFVGGDLNISQ